MKRLIPSLVVCALSAFAQIPSVPNTDFPTFRSNLNTSLSYANGHVNGVAYPAGTTIDTVPILVNLTSGVSYVSIPNCAGALSYSTSTHSFSCSTSLAPTAHAATHGSSGGDPVSLDASQINTGIIAVARLPGCAASGGSHGVGLLPDAGASSGTTRFLREDCAWVAITGSNATQLQGRALASTAPTNNQVVRWNTGANQWEPATPDFAWLSGVLGSGQMPAFTGDATNSGLAITVSKTGGVSFAPSATTDTTNAANIVSGALPNARIVALPNANLQNSAVTITPSCGVAGGGSVSLGGTSTLNGAAVVDSQTGSSPYAIPNSSCGKLVSRNQAAAVSDTLAQAGGGGNFASGWYLDYQCRGAGGCTITPATSTIDGSAAVALVQGQGMRIFSDGSNYFTQRGGGVGGSQTVSRMCEIPLRPNGGASLTTLDGPLAACGTISNGDSIITSVSCASDGTGLTVDPTLENGTHVLATPLGCGTAIHTFVAATANGTPTLHSYGSNGSTCANTPCSLDGTIAANTTATTAVLRIIF